MNRGECRHPIEIWEMITNINNINRLGEQTETATKVKEVFAKIEFRGGGLLTGRPADSVLSETTQKFTYPYNEFPNLKSDKNYIVYRNKKYKILYTLNENEKDEYLQVFSKEDNNY